MLNLKSFRFTLTALALPMTLVGCVGSGEEFVQPEFAPSYQNFQARSENREGSIFQSGTERTLFEDIKARRIGDILTVLLVEATSGQNSSDNNVSNSTGSNLGAPNFGGSSRPNMAVTFNSENSFNGQAGSSQSNSLTGAIAVTVSDVLPNGNLVIEGEKWVQINQGNEYIKLQGVVRPKDIGTFNTLYSTQVADARISYGGKGNNARSNNPGWASKLLFSPIWPF